MLRLHSGVAYKGLHIAASQEKTRLGAELVKKLTRLEVACKVINHFGLIPTIIDELRDRLHGAARSPHAEVAASATPCSLDGLPGAVEMHGLTNESHTGDFDPSELSTWASSGSLGSVPAAGEQTCEESVKASGDNQIRPSLPASPSSPLVSLELDMGSEANEGPSPAVVQHIEQTMNYESSDADVDDGGILLAQLTVAGARTLAQQRARGTFQSSHDANASTALRPSPAVAQHMEQTMNYESYDDDVEDGVTLLAQLRGASAIMLAQQRARGTFWSSHHANASTVLRRPL